MEMQAFHDIESLRHVCEDVKRHCEYAGKEVRPTVKFRGTVKLHGTNGGVRVNADSVVAQGRNRVLTIQSDNFGFAHFTAGRESEFIMLRNMLFGPYSNRDVTFYGEWCGQGIQKKVAVASLPKMFVIFAIYDHTADEWLDIHAYQFNDTILGLLNSKSIFLITQAPVFEVEIDFNNPTPAAELISQYTLQVEDCCPYSAVHGVEGMGEGLVWVSYDYPVRLYFKSKGEKHKKGGPKEHVAVDPEKVNAISELVDLILPEWRLEQGFDYLRTQNIPLANTSTGHYLKWIAQDILKEESDRIAANPYPWKEVQGTVMTRAKDYFFKELNEMAGLSSPSEAVV
jgi:hypothetical protein